MRVWIVNQNAYTPEQSAGTRHYALACELRRLGHEPLVVATSFYHKARVEARLRPGETWKFEDVLGAPFLWIRTPPYKSNSPRRIVNWLVFAGRVYRGPALRSLPKPDVIVGSSPPPFGPWAALHLARRLGCPFVYEVRDLWPLTLVQCGGISRRHPLVLAMAAVERQMCRGCTTAVSLLPLAEPYLRSRGLREGAFVHIPNGIHAGEWERPRRDLPPEHLAVFDRCRAEGKLTVVYVGAQGPANALDQVLALSGVLRDDPPYHFVLIGDGASRQRLLKESAARRCRFVSLLPRISKDQARTALDLADVCLFSLRPDPVFEFGVSSNKLFDYMMAGKPILFAARAGNDPVGDAGAGICTPPYDPQALDEAVRRMAGCDAMDRVRMGERGRQYVLAHHDWTRLARFYAETLETAVAKHKAAPLAASEPET